MRKFKAYKFSDLYDISSGISSKKDQAGHGAPFVSFSTVFNNYILPDRLLDLMDTSEKEQKIYSVKKGDILITRTSETLDELAMSSVALKDYPKATFSGFLKRLRPKQKNITYDKYMAFYLRSPYFRKIINNNTNMTLRASFNEDIFFNIEILLPDYEIQKKIGDFLYSIEKKIRYDQELKERLDKKVRLLYQYWFLKYDFPNNQGKPYLSSGGEMVWCKEYCKYIPKGWKVKKVSQIGKVISGGTPSTTKQEYFCKDGIAWITPKDMADTDNKYIRHGQIDITEEGLNKSSANLMPKGSILLTSRAPIGYLGIADNEICTNQGFKSIVPNNMDEREYIYYTLLFMVPYLKNLGTGSTFAELSKEILSQVDIIVPEQKVLKEFCKYAMTIGNKINQCEKENELLKKIRDYLLPLLISGQVILDK